MNRIGNLPLRHMTARLRNGRVLRVQREPRLHGPWVYLSLTTLPAEPGAKLGDPYSNLPSCECWLVDGAWREDRVEHPLDIVGMGGAKM
jgi:hypothetical protein